MPQRVSTIQIVQTGEEVVLTVPASAITARLLAVPLHHQFVEYRDCCNQTYSKIFRSIAEAGRFIGSHW